MLLNWGKDRAREEGVPVILEALPPGLPLYETAGFKTIVAAGARQMPSYVTTNMIWEPEGRQGEFLTEEVVRQSQGQLRHAPSVILVG